jgi:hypothetical protein
MFVFHYGLIGALVLGSAGYSAEPIRDNDSGIANLPDKRYVHVLSRMSLQVGQNWQKIYEPYRPRKTGTTSVMGMEENLGLVRDDKQQPKNVVMVYFTPMGPRPFSDIVNASEKDDKLGEEYDILVTVYGKEKVERPVQEQIGEFKVFKIVINAGPDSNLQGAGVMYLFQVGTGDNRWRIKVRGTFPITGREQSIKTVQDVVKSFRPEAEIFTPEMIKEFDERTPKLRKEPLKEVVIPPVKEPAKKVPQ